MDHTQSTRYNITLDGAKVNATGGNGSSDNYSDHIFIFHSEHDNLIKAARSFFLYFTPVIIVIGIVGNSLSVAVFCSKSMRKLSASTYLAALAISDICTLVFYVFVEWLKRGENLLWSSATFSFLNKDGFCQCFVYLSYVSRIMSAWIIVIFTVERFTGICYPLKSFRKGATRIMLIMLSIAAILVLYKPLMLREHPTVSGVRCAPLHNVEFISFVLDSVFGILITLIPFLIITVLNLLIVRKLFIRNMRSSEDTQIRLEFTMILFAISFFFVAFNAPYFVVWSKFFILNSSRFGNPPINLISEITYWGAVLSIVRTIFYMNYCVNFFLYSITGAYFRRELCDLMTFRNYNRRDTRSYIRCSRYGSSRTQVTSANTSVSLCATYTA